jgi:hypothetical protein
MTQHKKAGIALAPFLRRRRPGGHCDPRLARRRKRKPALHKNSTAKCGLHKKSVTVQYAVDGMNNDRWRDLGTAFFWNLVVPLAVGVILLLLLLLATWTLLPLSPPQVHHK